MTNESGIILNSPISNKHTQYLQLLLEANEKTNLTAIKDYGEAYIKHLQDSLAISLWDGWDQVERGIDLGSGGGLPGIPLAISFPNKQFILLESNNKKVRFMTEVKQELNLNNVEIIHGRAEEYGQNTKWRESMDFIISRAVASLSVLIELSIPLLKIKGTMIAYKGPNIDEEIMNSMNARQLLKTSDPMVISYELPEQAGSRNLVIMEKLGPTDKSYPRRPGMPEKRPL